MDDVLCGSVTYSSSKAFYEIHCGRSGKTVKITQDGSEPLTLCEVKAFRGPLRNGRKITFSRTTQSRTEEDGVASRAVDGNYGSRYADK